MMQPEINYISATISSCNYQKFEKENYVTVPLHTTIINCPHLWECVRCLANISQVCEKKKGIICERWDNFASIRREK
jgi:hypothetical protein